MPKPENIEPHKYKKGESGNPTGRPKGSRNRSTIVREWMEAIERAKNPITGEIEELTQADIATLAVLKKARSGDVNAYRELMDSAFGKNPDTSKIDHTSGGDKVESVIVQYVKPKD